jgi:hypothetical protein
VVIFATECQWAVKINARYSRKNIRPVDEKHEKLILSPPERHFPRYPAAPAHDVALGAKRDRVSLPSSKPSAPKACRPDCFAGPTSFIWIDG